MSDSNTPIAGSVAETLDKRDSGTVPKLLASVTSYVARHPRRVGFFILASVAGCVCLTVGLLEFKTDRSDLIDPNAPFHQRWLSFTRKFGNTADLIVAIEAATPETVHNIQEELARRLKAEPELFAGVFYKMELRQLKSKGLQYLSPEELQTGLENLQIYRPMLEGHWERTRLQLIVERLKSGFQKVDSGEIALTSKSGKILLNHAEAYTRSLALFLGDDRQFEFPWQPIIPNVEAVSIDLPDTQYLTNKPGDFGFVHVQPVIRDTGFSGPSENIHRLREIIRETQSLYPSAEIGLTGIPVLEADEMAKSQEDMTWASMLSFSAVGLLMFAGFQGFRHPFLALITLAVAIAWTFGATTFAVGHLNILSVSFAAILIGLGIDYAIHYLSRYLELRRSGVALHEALENSSASTGIGILVAAITTALAFCSASFTQFLGVAELGIIAAIGIALCTLATFIALPALISIADQKLPVDELPTPFQGRFLRGFVSRFPVIGLLSLVSFGSAAAISLFESADDTGEVNLRVTYDSNLLNLQADGLPSVAWQNRIAEKTNGSLLYAVAVANSEEDARRLRQQFKQLPTVNRVEELSQFLPDYDSSQTQLMVHAFYAQLARLPDKLQPVESTSPKAAGMALENLLDNIRKFDLPQTQRIAGSIDLILNEMTTMSLKEQVTVLTEFETRSQYALLEQFKKIRQSSNPEPVTLADIPPQFQSRYLSEDGEWLVQIYPKEQIWEPEPLGAFVADLRMVDANVTGTPLQNFEASRQIQASYFNAAFYAFAIIQLVLLSGLMQHGKRIALWSTTVIVCLLLSVVMIRQWSEIRGDLLAGVLIATTISITFLLDRRSLGMALLALLPPVVGSVMTFGILAELGVALNPANLIVLPLILGIGVDDGVHVVHDYRSQKGSYRPSSSMINAIVLTSLTSIIGFGSLILATHKGLSSLGLVLVVGVSCCMFVSLIPLPAILTLMSRSRKVEQQPAESANTLRSAA